MTVDAQSLIEQVRAFLAENDPATMAPAEFIGARYDAGLGWVSFPAGLGGQSAPRSLQAVVDAEFAAAGAPTVNTEKLGIGLGMAAPTILAFGTEAQHSQFLRPLYTGEEVWCQLFSEPGAGSDLAGLATRAVRDGDDWIVNGQKVWTSVAHEARWGILLTRSDPDVPKHRGLTYFICDMTAPGVEVRPLRQMTGESTFNEVFLTDVRIPDAHRLGEVGDGWRVANTTLMNERVAIGGQAQPREGGLLGPLTATWRERPELRSPALHDALLRLWVDAETFRLTGARLKQQLAAGQPGPEGSAAKLTFATLNQEITGLMLELLGEEGLLYDDYSMRANETRWVDRSPGWAYLRMRANSIEGGTSEVLRNVIAERLLGLPSEPRVDKDVAWKDLPR